LWRHELLPPTLTLDALRAIYLDRPFAVKDAVEEVLAACRDGAGPGDFHFAASCARRFEARGKRSLERAPDPSLMALGDSFAVKKYRRRRSLHDTRLVRPLLSPGKRCSRGRALRAAERSVLQDQSRPGRDGARRTRSALCAPHSVFHAEYVSGGSS